MDELAHNRIVYSSYIKQTYQFEVSVHKVRSGSLLVQGV